MTLNLTDKNIPLLARYTSALGDPAFRAWLDEVDAEVDRGANRYRATDSLKVGSEHGPELLLRWSPVLDNCEGHPELITWTLRCLPGVDCRTEIEIPEEMALSLIVAFLDRPRMNPAKWQWYRMTAEWLVERLKQRAERAVSSSFGNALPVQASAEGGAA